MLRQTGNKPAERQGALESRLPALIIANGGNTMEITDIRIRQMSQDAKMKAVVSVTFDNCFVVHDIKIIEGQDKLFIAMPSRKTPDNEFKDIAHPINIEMRELLSERILEKYNSTMVEQEAFHQFSPEYNA